MFRYIRNELIYLFYVPVLIEQCSKTELAHIFLEKKSALFRTLFQNVC